MANRKKAKLQGLDVLGSRLKELRLKAGISQMKLAEILGLNPTHGYKYILRLEKGLVPNPTMRTITGYLTVCGATWQDIADVLPVVAIGATGPKEEKGEAAGPIVQLPYQPESPQKETEQTGTPVLTFAKKMVSAENFWQLVESAQRRGYEYLRLHNLSASNRRLLYSFIRAVCTVIARTPADALESKLKMVYQQAVKQGLEPNILNRLKVICLEVFAQKETPG